MGNVKKGYSNRYGRDRKCKPSYLWVPVFLILCFPAIPAFATTELAATVDRNQVSLGDSLQLTLKAEGRVNSQPDVTPLKKDFDVFGISSSSQANFINGQVSSSTSWSIPLMPKRTGILTIPVLEVAGQRSQPISITVTESSPQGSSAGDVFLESEASPDNPYVQQQVILTIRLYYDEKLREGSLSAPEPANTIVRQLGKDKTGAVNLKGKNYQVLERRYALFPQASGSLEIPAPIFNGIVAVAGQRRSHFGSMFDLAPFDTATKRVRKRGKPVTIAVQPRPAQASGSLWLPASALTAKQSWNVEEAIKVGSPVTMTVTLEAEGLTASQLPNLEPEGLQDFNIYPDKADEETLEQVDGVRGVRSQKIAFIPTRPGTLTLPDQTLYWWDVANDRQEELILSGRSITVLPSGEIGREPEQHVEQASSPVTKGDVGQTLSAAPATADVWPWVAAFFAVLWVGTLGLYITSRTKPKKDGTPPPTKEKATRTRAARATFISACRENNPASARSSLLAWAAAHWPDTPPKGLEELGKRLDSDQQVSLLHELDAALYRGKSSWKGDALRRAFAKLPVEAKKTGEEDSLKLYPSA
jgi:hypothetical protein